MDYLHNIETLRQLTTGLLPQIRSQIQRVQLSRTPMEMSGHLNHLSAIAQQHVTLLLSSLSTFEESLQNIFPPPSVDAKAGDAPLPEAPLAKASPVSPVVPAPSEESLNPPSESPTPTLAAVDAARNLQARLALLNECREFCLWQIDEMNQEIAQLSDQLEASRAATRRHMSEVVRLEQALKKVAPGK